MSTLQKITQHTNFKKIVIGLFLLVSALAWFSTWLYGHYYVSTDDAYINANIVQIAPRVTGKINNLYVINNHYVKQGDLLFSIDPEPFQLAVNIAKAALSLSMAELENATAREKRTSALVGKHFLSPQEGDNTTANFKIAAAKVEQAKAQLAQANLNLEYTNVRAPTSGWVTNVSLRTGDIVPANQQLFALISDEEFWVEANFKETEIVHIKPGQPATIVADMYPDYQFAGTVESISSGTGAVFSLLPPQNATGNWVKVTQRIPIRIHLSQVDHAHPLRIGSSTTVTIHLH